MTAGLEVEAAVAEALAEGRAVVALETTLIAHGLPPPLNLETALEAEAAVREAGAVPASIGILDGKVRVGLSGAQLERFAGQSGIVKVSSRDIAAVVARGGDGATTVAATLVVAAKAGIAVFATGGIGGVHRGGESSLDVSADLYELARRPVAVVAAGAKAILDLPRTLELLESLGVPVVGYGTDELPAFYARASGLRLEARVDSPQAAAKLMRSHWNLGMPSGLLLANPPPAETALEATEAEALIAGALEAAAAAGIAGKDTTPYLLQRVAESSSGRTLAANRALIVHNARVAGAIASAYAAQP
ncbi:MAG: pseudouridine-5'-phosphate glycosidase [Kiloniellales bacterium]|nr:pseudouridine-5'-phosphate glycosidase [Kiloniellales bacterium]